MIDFTGERFVPSETGEIRVEHMHRYALVSQFCTAKTVLDIASGEGYGSALLARHAQSVIGIDISHEAVDHAKKIYGVRDNLNYAQGSATAIPLPSMSIDIVVSFETIEHLAEQEEMLQEIRRVLKPEGLLIISSPNKKVYSEDRGYINEFHVKELYFEEFDALLRRQFPAIAYCGQRLATGSMTLPMDQICTGYEALKLKGNLDLAETMQVKDIMYFIALCASDATALPKLKASFYVDEDIDLYADTQKTLRWASDMDRQFAELSAKHVKLQSEFDERTAWALKLDAELAKAQADFAALLADNTKLEEALRMMNAIYAESGKLESNPAADPKDGPIPP